MPHITVCVCTYQRPVLLERLLRAVALQESKGAFSFSVVVADNDAAGSGRATADQCAAECGLEIRYTLEPRKNIAHARNLAVAKARGDFVAFIDDDEFPVKDWLWNLFQVCERHQVVGVLGPVKPHFDEPPPAWVVKGGFYDRPTHPTGFEMPWPECRTGNVLLRRAILGDGRNPSALPFRPEFGTGGEDQDFFRRMIAQGHRFLWCDEAVAYEVVPPARWSRRFMLSRALLRGKNSFRQGGHRARNLAKALAAVPLYTIALPVLFVAGHHHFMKYLVKLVDHAGRLLAAAGLNPADERRM